MRRSVRFYVCWAISMIALASIAPRIQAAPQPDPPSIPAVRDQMNKFVEMKEIAGAVTLVATRDNVVHLDATGFANIAAKKPMRPDTMFWIASMTKPITATAVLMLQEDGKLSVDDLVEKYLPEFANLKTDKGDPAKITIRQLLTHSSGLAEATADESRNVETLAAIIPFYLNKPLQFTPGSKWAYCQSGINTAGRIIEVASGKSFDEFLAERLFHPLGMKDTTFYPTEEQISRLATSYRRSDQGELIATDTPFLSKDATAHKRFPAANGGLFSTAADYARFCQMILRGGEFGGKRYLKPESVELMTSLQSGQLKTGFTDGCGWGLGWCLVRAPQGVTATLSRGTFGHGGAYGTQVWIDPQKGRIQILMVQRANFPNSDASDVRKGFHEAAKPEPPKEEKLGPDSLVQEGVPQGKLNGPFLFKSKILAGTVRKYWIYVPVQYKADKPACVLVFQDGARAINPKGALRIPVVMDNLIHKKEMPVTIGIFITPGQRGEEFPDTIGTGNPTNRSAEYDSLGDAYARFIVEEMLPEVGKSYNLTKDPEGRVIGGSSSGAICAFTVAWEQPDQFRKVISMIGSFTDIRGGHVYPEMIRKSGKKPIRVFLQDGVNDNRSARNPKRDWHLQNQAMVAALQEKGYDMKFVFGEGAHSDNHGGALLPDILRWMFRDYAK